MAISDHLSILSQEEINLLYDVPKIDEEDRQLLFEITPEDEAYLNQQTIVNNKINIRIIAGHADKPALYGINPYQKNLSWCL